MYNIKFNTFLEETVESKYQNHAYLRKMEPLPCGLNHNEVYVWLRNAENKGCEPFQFYVVELSDEKDDSGLEYEIYDIMNGQQFIDKYNE